MTELVDTKKLARASWLGNPSNVKTLIQFQDETNSPLTISLLASDLMEQLPLMSYIVINSGEAEYFAQIQEPARWLNLNASQRFDPSSLDTLQRIDRREYEPDAYFRLVQYYCADVLAQQIESGSIIAPITRPRAGSCWIPTSTEEARKFLSLSKNGNSIGVISGITTRDGGMIEVRVNAEILRHHIMSAGSTGFGKSNTNVNLIIAGQDSGFCVLVFDMKPDYSEIDKPNDERLAGGVEAAGVANVSFWTLGTSDQRRSETPISVGACELDPAKLASVIFYRPGEELQQEVAEQLLSGFADIRAERSADRNDSIWSMADFIAWLMSFADAPAAEAVMPFRVTFNKQTFNAVRSKIARPGRVPSWIDASTSRGSYQGIFGGQGQNNVAADQLFAQLAAGRVHVIRVRADADGRSYALFLDYAMRRVADLRRDQSSKTPPVMHLIDECPDLFKSSNKRLRDAMEGTLDEQIRKGRSLSIAFVLSAQSAGDIPERIRHNLNSVVVFQHRQPKVLQEILPTMSDAIRDLAAKLQRGEALVQLFGTYGLLRCRMDQSPAMLFKPPFGA